MGHYLHGPSAPDSHFSSYIASTSTDLDSAMLPAALVLVLASVALASRPELSTAAFMRLLGAVLAAAGLWLLARPGGPSTPEPGGLLLAALLALAVVAVAWCTSRRRRDPVAGVLGAAILAVAAPEGVWLLPSLLPNEDLLFYEGAWEGVGIAVMAAGGLIAPLACLALVGRGHATAD